MRTASHRMNGSTWVTAGTCEPRPRTSLWPMTLKKEPNIAGHGSLGLTHSRSPESRSAHAMRTYHRPGRLLPGLAVQALYLRESAIAPSLLSSLHQYSWDIKQDLACLDGRCGHITVASNDMP